MRYRKFPLNADLKGLFLGIHERWGCKFGDSKIRDCPLSKWGGCSLELVPNLKESVPPPGGELDPDLTRLGSHVLNILDYLTLLTIRKGHIARPSS